MLENRKNTRKIIVILMSLIAILSVFINLIRWRTEKREINTIGIEEFGKAKNSLTVASIDLEERSNNSDVQT